MNNEGLSEIDGPFPVPPPRDNRERNDNQEQREEATGTSAVCKPLLPSIIVIGSRPTIVTTLTLQGMTIPENRKQRSPVRVGIMTAGVNPSQGHRIKMGVFHKIGKSRHSD